MLVRFLAVISVVLLTGAAVLAQPGATVTGEVQGWQDGEAEIVLLAPRYLPPRLIRPPDSPAIGRVGDDGSFTITLPDTFPAEEFVPVAGFLDPGCSELLLEPADAVYFPIAYGAYRSDGSLIGEIFRGSPDSGRGPLPGEYATLPGYAAQAFTLRGECPDTRRGIVEDYDLSVDAGWHEIVQSFAEHDELANWRVDRWRNEPVPQDATWVVIRPPR